MEDGELASVGVTERHFRDARTSAGGTAASNTSHAQPPVASAGLGSLEYGAHRCPPMKTFSSKTR
jgi:hypothetical protein